MEMILMEEAILNTCIVDWWEDYTELQNRKTLVYPTFSDEYIYEPAVDQVPDVESIVMH